MPVGSFVAFATLDILLVITPGADWAFAIAAGLAGRNVRASVAGLAAGYLAPAALVTVGVGALMARDPLALSVLTLVGAAYLVSVGIAVTRRPAPLLGDRRTGRTPFGAWLRGAAVSGLNPKGLLMFFALLPQFVASRAPWPVPLQLAALACFHIAACGIVYLWVALGARRLLRSRPRASQLVGRASGISMIAIGLGLTVERALGA